MKYVILAEKDFKYSDFGPDFDEPIFGKKQYIFEIELRSNNLIDVEKEIKQILNGYDIVKYQGVKNPATAREVDTLTHFGMSEFQARTRTQEQAIEFISNQWGSMCKDVGQDWPDPMEDWLQNEYIGVDE